MPARYVVRIETDEGIREVSIGTDLDAETKFAQAYHAKHRVKIWIFNLKTGQTVWRAERVERQSAGGAA